MKLSDIEHIVAKMRAVTGEEADPEVYFYVSEYDACGLNSFINLQPVQKYLNQTPQEMKLRDTTENTIQIRLEQVRK